MPSQRTSTEVFCKYKFTMGEKSTEEMADKGGPAMWLPHPSCCFTATISTVQPPDPPPSNREHLQHCCGFQRRWLVAQRLFHMLGHIAHSLLQLCRERGKHNLIITAMKSIRSTSATREVL